jgi:exodeoxyribonuclease VII large subunit
MEQKELRFEANVNRKDEQSLSNERMVLSISEIVDGVKNELQAKFRDIWIQGEISNLRRPSSGHLYFTLKDESSQLSAVCFRMRARYMKFQPEDGMDVVVRGSVSVYVPRGQLQFMVEQMEPLGRGALQVAFEQLKARLEAEGLFDPAHKRELPLLPSKVGIVTSSSGAAIQDILRVLRRRNDRVSILLYPTRVQGEGAAAEIAEAIERLSQRPDIDVIIAGRGGGSLEDLWPFNEEIVARAIYDARVPVISAVGHEIDFTISDFVADLRAPTPSAAAEIVSGKREELLSRVSALSRQCQQLISLQIASRKAQYQALIGRRAFIDAQSRVRMLIQRLDELRFRLTGVVPSVMERRRVSLVQNDKDLRQLTLFLLKTQRQGIENWTERLRAYSPQQVLDRGYAIVTSASGAIVRDPQEVSSGEKIQVRVAKGVFSARREEDDGV